MPLHTTAYDPMPKPPRQLALPRLMQDTCTGTVFLITAFNVDTVNGRAEGVALYHQPPLKNADPWPVPPNMEVGEWGGSVILANLDDYPRQLSMMNNDC